MTDRINCRLALILPHSRRVVAAKIDDTYVLPQISIPLWERPAEHLTQLIEERWHITSIVLDIVFDDRPESPCAIIEVRSSFWSPSTTGLSEVDLDTISEHSIGTKDRKVLGSILTGEDFGRGPFSRIGWIDDAHAWVQRVTNDRGSPLTGETLHLNADGHFCLIRFAASSGAGYWLKATGEPNTREFGITTFLSAECPKYLPRLIAVREDWNAWLTEEHGFSMRDSDSLEDFRQAVRDMADLQKALIGRTDTLLDACCSDQRNQTLRSRIAELFSYLDEAMALQTSKKAPKLSCARLKELKTFFHDACSLQQDLAIPDSLIHGDINPGNILLNGSRCVFTDWCEAGVGNPFITLEQMCVHADRISAKSELWRQVLRDQYKASWRDVLSEGQIASGLQLARLLSILSSLHGRGDWLNSPARYEPQRLSYCRSLARHMDRAARTTDLREALCM